ncbi:CCA tRNA nucleotidyltransferase, mitochondrial [Entophlyctis luteolus]|nr:CCA tRNA nucleotidyltransferase, mitochondrial [Entophlyctis luteolus]
MRPLLFDPSTLDIGHTPHPQHILTEIRLTPIEDRICSLLVAVADHLAVSANRPVVLRIAGGWVRDKLLGLESHDLDIALDSMMGFEFAQAVKEFVTTNSHHTLRDGESVALDASVIGGVSKIDSNPDKSKHLETATTRVFGQMIDFVNLRTEVYNEESRVPTVEFGTPLQDALRRDITINSLFYNLHTRSVEDYTNMGLKDLASGHIRTPLPPLQTFVDDPLRILRVIRFAARFGFSIDPSILQATREHPHVRRCLAGKISRERIGTEVDKMLRDSATAGGDGVVVVGQANGAATRHAERILRAIRLLHEFGIAEDVLTDVPLDLRYFGPLSCGATVVPVVVGSKKEAKAKATAAVAAEKGSDSSMDSETVAGRSGSRNSLMQGVGLAEANLETGLEVAEALTALLQGLSADEMRRMVPLDSGIGFPFQEEDVRLLYLAAMMHSFSGRLYLEKKKSVLPASKYVVMNSLKLSSLDGDWTSTIIENIPKIQEMVSKISNEAEGGVEGAPAVDEAIINLKQRQQVGMFVRELGVRSIYPASRPLGGKYVLAVFLAQAVEVSVAVGNDRRAEAVQEMKAGAARAVVDKYLRFWGAVERLGVGGAHLLKPLMNGGEVCGMLGIRAGPGVKPLLDGMIEYQMGHPSAGRREVEAWLQEQQQRQHGSGGA